MRWAASPSTCSSSQRWRAACSCRPPSPAPTPPPRVALRSGWPTGSRVRRAALARVCRQRCAAGRHSRQLSASRLRAPSAACDQPMDCAYCRALAPLHRRNRRECGCGAGRRGEEPTAVQRCRPAACVVASMQPSSRSPPPCRCRRHPSSPATPVPCNFSRSLVAVFPWGCRRLPRLLPPPAAAAAAAAAAAGAAAALSQV